MAQKRIYSFFALSSRQATLLAERWLGGVRNGVQSLMKNEADHCPCAKYSGRIVYTSTIPCTLPEFVSSRCNKTVRTSA